MKKTYRPPEILKIPIDLQDILTTSNELEPDITLNPATTNWTLTSSSLEKNKKGEKQ